MTGAAPRAVPRRRPVTSSGRRGGGALAAVLAVRDGVVPATRNLDVLDPEVKLDVVAGAPRRGR
ncbi:hypothetical protein ABZ498_34755 [Streptomyces lavendulocolor]|uniref:hypothetical protein n=1 Tax=Streptomyces lavendulocolor TaxID=67316 RepID=UPI0033E5B626